MKNKAVLALVLLLLLSPITTGAQETDNSSFWNRVKSQLSSIQAQISRVYEDVTLHNLKEEVKNLENQVNTLSEKQSSLDNTSSRSLCQQGTSALYQVVSERNATEKQISEMKNGLPYCSGAEEWPVSSVTEYSCTVVDLNDDGTVNISDLLLVLSFWGPNAGPGDINGDGVVNISDLLILLGLWGDCDLEPQEPMCGNGIVEVEIGERCDDGNLTDGDGCSSTCQIEPGFTQVCTVQDLDDIRNNLQGNYIQTCDINLAGVDFPQIGNSPQGIFWGIYNGGGFSIRNFSYEISDQYERASLFYLIRGLVQSIRLENISIVNEQGSASGIGDVGKNGKISDSYVEGYVRGMGATTGPVKYSGAVSGQVAAGMVENTQAFVDLDITVGGGFVGLLSTTINSGSLARISDSYYEGNINVFGPTGFGLTGGFVGGLISGGNDNQYLVEVKNSQAKIQEVQMNSDAKFGGFVGDMTHFTKINNSQVEINSISGSGDFGGFVLRMFNQSQVINSSAKISYANITPHSNSLNSVGGFVGGFFSSFQLDIPPPNPKVVNSSAELGEIIYQGDTVGGFAGYISNVINVEILDSNVKADRIDGVNNVGGFIGKASTYNLKVERSYAEISDYISGVNNVGGFAGLFTSSGYSGLPATIKETYAIADIVSTGENAGGFFGRFGGHTGTFYPTARINVENSYFKGSVSGINRTGGFAGLASPGFSGSWDNSGIFNSYSASVVNGSNNVGGFIGSSLGGAGGTFPEYDGLYWDINIAGILPNCGSGTGACNAGIFATSTPIMQQQSTYSGWDFGHIWDIINGQTYPFFQWENPAS